MNDLPQYELLSAYLDGEVSADEHAEVERLLAADPAARQLLDELRALSGSLHALPRQTLGEDLSQAVLQVAERRRRDEDGSDRESVPTPFVKSIFRRFATQRNLVWLSLTAAVAVMIVVNEHRQDARSGNGAGREVAVAPAAKRSGPTSTVSDALKPLDRESKDSAKEPWSSPTVQAAPEPSADAPRPRPSSPSELTRDESRSTGEAAPGKSESDEHVMVVHCQISFKAAEHQEFDELLLSNGIAPQEPRLQAAEHAQVKGKEAKDGDAGELSDAVDREGENFVYVEATPAQVAATLAGLEAKPDAFPQVSIAPAEDPQTQELLRRNVAANQVLIVPSRRQSGFSQTLPAVRGSTTLGRKVQATLGAEAREAAVTLSEAASSPQKANHAGLQATPTVQWARPAEVQNQIELRRQLDPAAARQRVLFVLRVVDPATATRESPVESKPAESP